MVKVLKTNLTLKTCPLGASFSSFGCFVFDLGVFVFELLGASFSSLGCFVFEICVLRASCFVLRSSFSNASFSKLYGCLVFEISVLRASVFVFECFVFETTITRSR